jgi:hypothetical protein
MEGGSAQGEPLCPSSRRPSSSHSRNGVRKGSADGNPSEGGAAQPRGAVSRKSFSIAVNMAPPSFDSMQAHCPPLALTPRAAARKLMEEQGQGAEGASDGARRRTTSDDAPSALPRSPSLSRSPSAEVWMLDHASGEADGRGGYVTAFCPVRPFDSIWYHVRPSHTYILLHGLGFL